MGRRVERSGVSVAPRRELVALVVLLALAALLMSRSAGAPSLDFDEGVYLSSAQLVAGGLRLGTDVFSSQPPLFLTLLDGAHRLTGGDAGEIRLLLVALTILGALAGWALVRRIAGPVAGVAAAGLVAVAPGVIDGAAVVSADVPCVALGTGALLAARASRQRAASGLLAGALLTAALLVKLLALPFALALAAGALVDRPSRRALAWFAGGVLGVGVPVALANLGALGALWDGAVILHLKARESDPAHPTHLPGPPQALLVILIVLGYAGLVTILAGGILAARGPARAWLRDRADLIALALGGIALCALQRPLLHHHLVAIAWPLALLAASALPARPRGRPLALVAAGLTLLVPWVVHGRILLPAHDRAQVRQLAAVVRADTQPGQAVVSDLPLVALAAGRPPAATTVDPSFVRVDTGSLTRAQVLRAADGAGAVVVARAFATIPGLDVALRARFAVRREVGGAVVYARPRGASAASDQTQAPSSTIAAASSSQKPTPAAVRPLAPVMP